MDQLSETTLTNLENTSDDALKSALEECRGAAYRGYQIAKENLSASIEAIGEVSGVLSQRLKSFKSGLVRAPGVDDQLKTQLSRMIDALGQLQRSLNSELEERRKRLEIYSIVLFGRTMAGKSTLMEILTRGDGHSIGTGAQRTTRDIRRYFWNGLEVTDVPGVAAFEGKEDEDLAFKAASQADLILFLITDDAPQPVEVECLAKVLRLGKPVIGICNVKVAVDDADDLQLFLRNPNRHFNQKRLEQLIDQFHAFADRHGIGKRVPFIFVHLRSRFLAQQPQYAQWRDQLLAASQFEKLESRIVREVIERGTFHRIKSFADGVFVPMMELTDQLLDFSLHNTRSGAVFAYKQRQFEEWSRKFETNGDERITTCVSKVMGMLRDEVPSFAENHYEDRLAGEKWNQVVKSIGIDSKLEKLQKTLLADCHIALSELARELKSELSIVTDLSADRYIQMDPITDWKRMWNWFSTLSSAGLGIAALIFASGPLGWAAAAVGIIGWLGSYFFEDREEKAQRARQNLSKMLHDNIDKMERKLRNDLGDWFHKEVLEKQIGVFLNDIEAVASFLLGLADTQRQLAQRLNKQQKALARTLVEEALVQLKAANLKDSIVDVARVPGTATMLLIQPDAAIPAQVRDELERLLGEKIWFVVDTGDRNSILAQAMGRDGDRNNICMENSGIAYVPLDDSGPEATARVRLAQQLTGFI